jgi:hypothetical protein
MGRDKEWTTEILHLAESWVARSISVLSHTYPTRKRTLFIIGERHSNKKARESYCIFKRFYLKIYLKVFKKLSVTYYLRC